MGNVLVDSGNTYNFIKPHIAKSLDLLVTSITPFKVFVANGDFIWCNALRIGIPVVIQGIYFQVDLFHLDIARADLVFGVFWMKSLGRVLIDYNNLTMEFVYEQKHNILYAKNLLQADPIKGHI